LPVDRYVEPAKFAAWEAAALAMGFLGVAAGPLVRSSYRAGELHAQAIAMSESFVVGNIDQP
jgi:lipoic acid synthetase